DFLLRECERSYPFKYLSIVRRSTFKSRANWLLLIFILELSISKFNFGKSSSPLISISVLISICICIIFTPKILCITNHLLYILIQSFMYIVRVSFINNENHLKIDDLNNTLSKNNSSRILMDFSYDNVFAFFNFLVSIAVMLYIIFLFGSELFG